MAPTHEGMLVHWEGLNKAGKACSDAEGELSRANESFRLGAQATDRCFGFIEGGSSGDVRAAYQEFYNGMLGHISGRVSSLRSCSKMLETSAAKYSAVEEANKR
jgi:hypothetical protein